MQIKNSLIANDIALLLKRNNKKQSGGLPARNLADIYERSNETNDSRMYDYSGIIRKKNTGDSGLFWDSEGRPRMLNGQGRLMNPDFSLPNWDSVQHEEIPLDSDIVKWRLFYQNRVNYANTFLFGRDGGEPIGQTAFKRFLAENEIELPENASFNIDVDRYGKVTVSGLDTELTARIESAMSYDFRFIRATLAMFIEAERTIKNNAIDGGMGFSDDQHRLMNTNSALRNGWGVGLSDLSLADGKIQGLPNELENLLYGNRAGMTRQESEAADRLRDSIIHFLRTGTENIPTYNISLIYADGRVSATSQQ